MLFSKFRLIYKQNLKIQVFLCYFPIYILFENLKSDHSSIFYLILIKMTSSSFFY